ncbi:MAG TPA: hypothetical protein VLA34_07165, partial [Candidatus Krumholzibacterium sp.]|nr:hypothetical protein [Candidatus Krumholzibacterium sp.]
KKINRIRFDIVSLVCAFVITILSSFPFFGKHTDAKILALVFGSFGTGVMLSKLIHDVRRDSNDK